MTDTEHLAEIRKRLTGWICPRKGLFAGDIEEIVFLLRLLDEREAEVARLKAEFVSRFDAVWPNRDAQQKAIYALGWGRVDGGPAKPPHQTFLDNLTCQQMVISVARAIEAAAQSAREAGEAEIARLKALYNLPETKHWFEGCRRESVHQQLRWGSDHDAGKSPFDWFWLIGFLAQKAADACVRGDVEKAKHHTISTGAALLNWHRQLSGEGTMRPGIEPPDDAIRSLSTPEGEKR